MISFPAETLLLGKRAFRMAEASESPLILWAAQSEEISLQLIPQTFSVYVLRKIEKEQLAEFIADPVLEGPRIGHGKKTSFCVRQ